MPEIISRKKEPICRMNFLKCCRSNKNHIEKLSHDTDYDGICDIYLSPPSNWFLTVTLVGIMELLIYNQDLGYKIFYFAWMVDFPQITNLIMGIKG